MRIAFVCGFAWEPKGTARARAFPLATELVKRGHEVTIFLSPYDNPRESGKERTVERVRIKNVEVGKPPGFLQVPLIAKRLCSAINQYSADVVHIFKPKGYAGVACAWLLAKGCRSVALDCDDWEGWGGWNDIKDYPWLVKEYIDCQEKWLLRWAPVVTAASRVLERRAVALRTSSKGVFYIPNCGVAPETSVGQERPLPAGGESKKQSFRLTDAPVILYSGHFESVDDVMFYCRAAAPAALYAGATLVFVGEGPELPCVKEYFSRKRGVDARFFPRVSYEEFIRLVAASDIAAFPYPDNPIYRAKCSVRIIDYMSMGKAVITTAVGQNTEYIVDGESGILAPPGDEARFCQELQKLLRNPELRARLGQNAERRVKQEFSWSRKSIETCLQAYQYVLGPDLPISTTAVKSSQ